MTIKTCSKCKQSKPIVEFHAQPGRKFGVGSNCKVCRNSSIAAYKNANQGKIITQNQAYKLSKKDEIIEKGYAYRERNKAKETERIKQWKSNNKHKVCMSTANRRASLLMATPSWSNSSKIESIYKTANKLTINTGIPHHVDHIVPARSKLVCGLHCEANLQVISGYENRSKSNRHWPDMP